VAAMNRRSFLSTLLAAPVAVKAAELAPLTSRAPYGFVDVPRWNNLGFGSDYTVFCDGREVTECRSFDDILGEAERYVLDADGKNIWDGGDDLRTEIVRGKIEIRRKS
jgi:hypothetical protein